MKLHPGGREYLTLAIITTPPLAAWELSVDGGQTWTPGESLPDDQWRWLIAGPAAATPHPANTVVVPRGTTVTWLRCIDAPEIPIRQAVSVYV